MGSQVTGGREGGEEVGTGSEANHPPLVDGEGESLSVSFFLFLIECS